ncbi:MAG: GTPase HflX [Burkholderiales bacterium]|nr:GTPase HflX [Burkholderiales bacterium]
MDFKKDKDFTQLVEEGIRLVDSAQYSIAQTMIIKRNSIDSKFFIGSGKVEELKTLALTLNADVIIVNHKLSSIQERNLELALKLPVIDRTRLILDIFAARVTGREGILQVELAIQTHQLSRLVRRWSHLERQRGGIGVRGGPGETQMELDKRMISDKIKMLKMRLRDVVGQRQIQRKSRLKNGVFSISIVGYTNCGKSTLFNILTKAKVYAENRLFATLETTSRKLYISDYNEVVLSDTVGFIRDLPHTLIAAFRATLEETVHANLLLHVVDVVHVLKERQIEDVNDVLLEIKAAHIPQLLIYNKIDLKKGMVPRIEYSDDGEPIAVYLSAATNIGIDLLRKAIGEKRSWIINQNQQQELTYEPWKH